jgi:hypothetical protein
MGTDVAVSRMRWFAGLNAIAVTPPTPLGCQWLSFHTS